jgi:hypothetical protein
MTPTSLSLTGWIRVGMAALAQQYVAATFTATDDRLRNPDQSADLLHNFCCITTTTQPARYRANCAKL